jgi:Glycosyltransferase family 9 (heptosyltransferase)/Tetratricopeptide repeat
MTDCLSSLFKESQKKFNLGKANEAINEVHATVIGAIGMLANLYLQARMPDKAIELLKISTEIDNKEWSTWSNIAHALNAKRCYEEAIDYINTADKLSPGNADINLNKGVILANLKRYVEAIETYSKCPKTYALAHYNKGCCLAILGQLEEAWNDMYLYRKDAFPFIKQFRERFCQPDWDGSKIDSLLIYNDQGIGDIIQFARYLPMVKEKASKIIFESQREIIKLLSTREEINVIYGRFGLEKNTLSPYDAVVSIADLPGIFGTNLKNIPNSVPYFKAPQTSKYDNLFSNDKKKIGICWAGSSTHSNDKFRSIPLINFKKLERNDIQLYGLQKESGERWFGNLSKGEVDYKDLAIHVYDFLETAQIIEKLDLVVTVDTAVAHLAGALGKQVYVLLPYLCDWRWLLERSDSPWYPTMRLFRQSKLNDWETVFEEVANAI